MSERRHYSVVETTEEDVEKIHAQQHKTSRRCENNHVNIGVYKCCNNQGLQCHVDTG